jgi:hypothetical protein
MAKNSRSFKRYEIDPLVSKAGLEDVEAVVKVTPHFFPKCRPKEV